MISVTSTVLKLNIMILTSKVAYHVLLGPVLAIPLLTELPPKDAAAILASPMTMSMATAVRVAQLASSTTTLQEIVKTVEPESCLALEASSLA